MQCKEGERDYFWSTNHFVSDKTLCDSGFVDKHCFVSLKMKIKNILSISKHSYTDRKSAFDHQTIFLTENILSFCTVQWNESIAKFSMCNASMFKRSIVSDCNIAFTWSTRVILKNSIIRKPVHLKINWFRTSRWLSLNWFFNNTSSNCQRKKWNKKENKFVTENLMNDSNSIVLRIGCPSFWKLTTNNEQFHDTTKI